MNSWTDKLFEKVKSDCLACDRCPLAATRTQVVWGRGEFGSDVLIVGEAPGAEEDKSGMPFVGRSGQLLNKLLIAANLDPDGEVFISNAVKCRPPSNRTPESVEIEACRHWLERQISLMRPKAIIAVGATALTWFTGKPAAITRLRGTWIYWKDTAVMPVFHPSYLLRLGGPQADPTSAYALTLEDLRKVGCRLRENP